MKRWPIIRHIRAIRAFLAVERHYAFWSSLGYLPANAESDYSHVRAIWRGEA